MSTDHRKPAVAFVALAFAAAALVGVHQADAQAGRFLAAVVGSEAHARGQVAALPEAGSQEHASLGPAFSAFVTGPSEDLSRTGDADDQVSRTQDRPPVPEHSASAKRDEATDSSSLGSTEQDRSQEGSSRRARDIGRQPGHRGVDRRRDRAAEHAAAHEERGSRPRHRSAKDQ
jgi:hypothetical protein